jgi:hypothetical protein
MEETKPAQRLEEILAEWDLDGDTGYESAVSHTFNLSSTNSNISITSPYTVTAPWMTVTPTGTGKLTLTGDQADVEVNGWSLVEAVKRIEQRLNLMQTNPELESEWAELRELGQQYRELEQRILDKQRVWQRLSAQQD